MKPGRVRTEGKIQGIVEQSPDAKQRKIDTKTPREQSPKGRATPQRSKDQPTWRNGHRLRVETPYYKKSSSGSRRGSLPPGQPWGARAMPEDLWHYRCLALK